MEDMRLFVTVIDAGSISKAADKMNVAKSAVSRRLALLEERLGTKLIDRDPGVWRISDTGHELYQRATRIVHEMDELEGDFSNNSAVIDGPLTVSVPRDFGSAFLSSALLEFKSRFPQIRLTVSFDDRRVDLDRENFDLALRISADEEAHHTAEQIGSVHHSLYASPNYLRHSAPINDLCDLKNHKLLYFGSARRAYWEFGSRKGKSVKFEFAPYLNSNSGLFLLEAVRADLGIARLPHFILAKSGVANEICRVLPDVAIPDWGIYLVHGRDRRVNRRMRLFSEEMKRMCLFHSANLETVSPSEDAR